MKKAFAIIVIVTSSVSACVSLNQNNVVETISSASALDGSTVSVTGRLHMNHNLMNLYSSDRKQCIGLILDRDEYLALQTYVGRNVSLRGELVAKGCGSDIICDEHLCGPVNLREVSLGLR